MVRVGSLLGPAGLGMVELMERSDNNETGNLYEFTLAGAPDELSGKLISGELDIAAVPTNAAAVLYQKTEGNVKIISTTTLGVLYLLERPEGEGSAPEEPPAEEDDDGAEDSPEESSTEDSDTDESEQEESAEDTESSQEQADADEQGAIASFADLKGRTIHSTGQGATQEYVLRYLLRQAGVDPDTDVTIQYHAEHAELAALMLEGKAPLALLPQPHVTTVMSKDATVTSVLDLTEEWESATGTQLAMGAIVVRSDFLEKNGASVDRFLEEFLASTEFANSNVSEAAALSGKFEIIKEEVAAKAIPLCNIKCLTGEELKESVSAYLEILFEAEPKSVGGALPDDAFYYIPG